MGFLSKLVGGSIGEMADGVAGAIDRFVETGEEKRAAERLMTKIRQDPMRWQAEINKIEAGHRSVFVAGWRPFIGWICGFALAYHYIGNPFLEVIFKALGMEFDFPGISIGQLITVLLAMLGVVGVRTYEKQKGLTS